jgi:hypothetical protein
MMMDCKLTGEQVEKQNSDHAYYYTVNIAGVESEIFICDNCDDKINWDVPQHIIRGLIANRI